MSERKAMCWFCERRISVVSTTLTLRYHLYPEDQEERPPLLVHGERCPGSGQSAASDVADGTPVTFAVGPAVDAFRQH